MDSNLQNFKSQFLRSDKRLHFNNAGQAPICAPTLEALNTWSSIFRTEGSDSYFKALPALESVRAQMAQFLGCKNTELAFVQGAAVAISQVALGLQLPSGSEIIVWDQEYPSNFYPWREAAHRCGGKLVVIPSPDNFSVPIELIKSKITSRTKVIATSWVQYKSGAYTHLSELTSLAKKHQIFTCADVIQGVGHYPFNFKETGLDAACGAGHKWLAAGHGTGYLCLREEHLDKIRPLYLGALSFYNEKDFTNFSEELQPSARRYEAGGKPFLDLFGLGAAIELFYRTGMTHIYQEASRLTMNLKGELENLNYKILSPHDSQFKGAILTFTPTAKSPIKDTEDLIRKLTASGITYAPRLGGVRLSPHAFNTDDEIKKVVSVLS